MKRIALLFVTLLALLASPLAAQPQFPELTGRVVDNANLLSPAEEAALTQKLEALEAQSQRQLVVATVPDLQGYDIADYGYQLGREWGIGDEERNDGALLIVAPNERKVRIEVGYGLEGYLTDALSSLIIQGQILPRFREGDFPGGIAAGTDAIVNQLALPEDQARQIAAQANQPVQQQRESGGSGFGFLIWLGIIFFFFILPMMRGRGRRRRFGTGSAVGDIILWEVGSAIARGAMSGGDDWGGGGGGFGGGFGGGGGFSGGGGSFGGGGASGGW